MNTKDLSRFLGLEAIAFVVAGGAFALIASRFAAGLVAGAYFIGSAGWMLNRVRAWPDRARALTLYPLAFHLFGVSIPMVVTRLTNANADFSDVRIWGLEGPVFHRLSTTVFGVLIAATIVDFIRAWQIQRSGAVGRG